MSAADVTPERMARLRRQYNTRVYTGDTVSDVHDMLNTIDTLRAELERMTDERNAWRTGHQDRLIEVDRLRAALHAAKTFIEDGECGSISRESALKIIWETESKEETKP